MIDLPPLTVVLIVATLVSVVGMPHGGLDHLFGRELFQPRFGRWWPLVFLLSYFSVAGLVIAGWFVAPVVTVVLFFLVSAWHFGDDPQVSQPANVVEGGMSIWVPLLCRPTEVSLLLAWVIPGGEQAWVREGIDFAQPVLWAIAFFFLVRVLGERTPDAAGRKVAFGLLFAVLPTLASFTIYFCGWHSTRELAALAVQADGRRPWRGLRWVMTAAAPMAFLAVVATVALAWTFAGNRERKAVVVQAVFLGLSAVAVPHILLHVVVRFRNLNPLKVWSPLCPNSITSSSAAGYKAG